MNHKLKPDDRHAVDFMLSRNGGPADLSGYAEPGKVSPERLASAEKTLRLLETYSVSEPPLDLISRTMARIDAAQLAKGGAAGQLDSISGTPLL